MAQAPLWQLVEQQSEPVLQDWPRTLQLPPGRLAQVPPVQVPVQHSAPEEQDCPTSVQSLFEHEPLTQLLRQQSVSVLQESPSALQNVGSAQTVPLHTPLQHGVPETQVAPDRTQEEARPPSGPPSVPDPPSEPGPFGLFELLTDPEQSQAPNVRTAPMADRTKNALELDIEEILCAPHGKARREDAEMIPPLAPGVEDVEVCSLRMQSAIRRA